MRKTTVSFKKRCNIGVHALEGFSLLEVMLVVGILAIVLSLVYGAFDGMAKTQKSQTGLNERYHQGRSAIERISREVQSAFLSDHQSISTFQPMRMTIFKGNDRSHFDRLDFTSFAHLRLTSNTHESDQSELGYFGSRNPKNNTMDLVRRESSIIDNLPEKDGVVYVLAENVEEFNLRYYDAITDTWLDSWDSSQTSDQLGRIPQMIHVKLVLKQDETSGKLITFQTKISLSIKSSLNFAMPK